MYTDQWNRVEKPEIDAHGYFWLLTEMQKQSDAGRAAFLTNGAADFGHAKKKKEESWTNLQVQKLTQK